MYSIVPLRSRAIFSKPKPNLNGVDNSEQTVSNVYVSITSILELAMDSGTTQFSPATPAVCPNQGNFPFLSERVSESGGLIKRKSCRLIFSCISHAQQSQNDVSECTQIAEHFSDDMQYLIQKIDSAFASSQLELSLSFPGQLPILSSVDLLLIRADRACREARMRAKNNNIDLFSIPRVIQPTRLIDVSRAGTTRTKISSKASNWPKGFSDINDTKRIQSTPRSKATDSVERQRRQGKTQRQGVRTRLCPRTPYFISLVGNTAVLNLPGLKLHKPATSLQSTEPVAADSVRGSVRVSSSGRLCKESTYDKSETAHHGLGTRDRYMYLEGTPYTLTKPLFMHGPIMVPRPATKAYDQMAKETRDWPLIQNALLGGIGEVQEPAEEWDNRMADDLRAWFDSFGFETYGQLISDDDSSRRLRPITPPNRPVNKYGVTRRKPVQHGNRTTHHCGNSSGGDLQSEPLCLNGTDRADVTTACNLNQDLRDFLLLEANYMSGTALL